MYEKNMERKTCYKLKRICINCSPSQGVAVNYHKAAGVTWPYLAAMPRFTVIPEERRKKEIIIYYRYQLMVLVLIKIYE